MSWAVHGTNGSGTTFNMTSHHSTGTHLLFVFQSILLAFEDFMGPARKQLATAQPTPNRWERPLDTKAGHVVLQLVGSDEFATPPLARYQPLRALVLLVDLLSIARLVKSHLLVGDLEPLLLPHPTPAAQ